MKAFIGDLFILREKGADEVEFEDLVAVMQKQRERHDEIHRAIFADISAGRMPQTHVVTVLNVNRELMNCQFWIVMALGSYHLSEAQADDLEQMPH